MEIETPVLLAYAIEDSTDIFRISGGEGGLNTPNPPSRYATAISRKYDWWGMTDNFISVSSRRCVILTSSHIPISHAMRNARISSCGSWMYRGYCDFFPVNMLCSEMQWFFVVQTWNSGIDVPSSIPTYVQTWKKLKQRIRRVRPNRTINHVLFLQDNAIPHTGLPTRETNLTMGWTVLLIPPNILT